MAAAASANSVGSMPSVSDDEKRFLKAREASEVLLDATRAYVESVFCTSVFDRVKQKVPESFRQQCQCGNHDFTCESEILVRANRCAKQEALEEDAYAKGPCLAKGCPGGLDCKHRFANDFPRPIALGPKAPAGLPAPTVPCHCEAVAYAICTELVHRGKATWPNSDPAKWAKDHIEVAKIFMPPMGKLEDGQPCQEARSKTEMGHFDITCLFGLLLNAKSLLINPQHRELAFKVLQARNHCLGHKPLSKLSEDEFANFIAACVDWVKALQELTAQESEMQRVFETLSLLAKPETLPDILRRATNDVEEFMLAKFSSEMLKWSPLFDGDCFVAMVERNDVLAARVYLETSRPSASALDALSISPAKDLGQDGTFLGNGVLNFAAGRGYFEMVRLLGAAGCDLNHTNCSSNSTPMHNAARHGHLKIVQFLLRNDADPNKLSTSGWTPLHIACYEASTGKAAQREVAEWLLQQRNERGKTKKSKAAICNKQLRELMRQK